MLLFYKKNNPLNKKLISDFGSKTHVQYYIVIQVYFHKYFS